MERPVELGPFELGECIGRGGMGKVFRAVHSRTGVSVAIKVILDGASRKSKQLFHREIQAHARLVHPGVAYLFDYGLVDARAARNSEGELIDGSPYVAMEWADRGTVRDHLPILDWTTIRHILVHVLDALAFSHARSVVHRDLKPENLLLFSGRDDDSVRVKLADFGIAHAFGEEHLRREESMATFSGTPIYMAPEQVRGKWRTFGPWTDLYALGCIIFELVCGKPPFERPTPVALAMAHCTAERPPLTPQIDVPAGLEEWIHRAITVDVRHRFRRAADAAFALPEALRESSRRSDICQSDRLAITTPMSTTCVLTREWNGVATIVDEPPDISGRYEQRSNERDDEAEIQRVPGMLRPPLPADWRAAGVEEIPTPLLDTGLGLFGLREIPFVDRARERDRIWEALRTVSEKGEFRIVLLIGDAGSGKSELARWAVTRAHEVGAAITLKAMHSAGGPGDSEGLPGLIHRAFRTWGLPRANFFEYLSTHLPQHDARAMTELVYPTDNDADDVDGPRYHFENSDQKLALVARLFSYILADRPATVWADDLQWGDETLALMEYLANRPESAPTCLVLGTVRSENVATDSKLRRRIDNLRRSSICDVIEVGALERPYQREMVDRMLPLEPALAEQLVERTEGIPLFMQQLLGEWVSADVLAIGAQGFEMTDGARVFVPDDIHALWTARIQRLAERYPDRQKENTQQALELAASLGRRVNANEWLDVCDSAGFHAPRDLVDGLVERGLATRTDDGWAYTHALLVESLERSAREAQRWQLHHKRCAQMLQRRSEQQGIARNALRIAAHWSQSGNYEEALSVLDYENRWCSRSGDLTLRKQVVTQRRILLEQLETDVDHSDWVQSELDLADVERQLGDQHMARERVERLLGRCDGFDDEAVASRVVDDWAEILQSMGRLKEAEAQFHKALDLARRSGDKRQHAVVHSQLGWYYYMSGDLDRAFDHCERGGELFRTGGSDYDKYRISALKAWIFLGRKDYEKAEPIIHNVIEWSRHAGYRQMESSCLNALGDIARFKGQLDRARRHYEAMAQIGVELNTPSFELAAKLNVVQIDLELADFQSAQRGLIWARPKVDELEQRAFRDLLKCCEVAWSSGVRSWEIFDHCLAEYTDDSDPDRFLVKDFPRLLEVAADFAEGAGKTARARRLWRIAESQWRQLGDAEAAERALKNFESQ